MEPFFMSYHAVHDYYLRKMAPNQLQFIMKLQVKLGCYQDFKGKENPEQMYVYDDIASPYKNFLDTFDFFV